MPCAQAKKIQTAYVATDLLSAEKVLFYEARSSQSSVSLDLTEAAKETPSRWRPSRMETWLDWQARQHRWCCPPCNWSGM